MKNGVPGKVRDARGQNTQGAPPGQDFFYFFGEKFNGKENSRAAYIILIYTTRHPDFFAPYFHTAES
ncbi:hypothetical protein LJC26_00615, partial [Desulfovibrio sp. OttesenSCG-928-O18]|nr:hypothetical protein [Desulfovibrio sp. OttesenSCG-928-O18]